jgi:hypothetical protein
MASGSRPAAARKSADGPANRGGVVRLVVTSNTKSPSVHHGRCISLPIVRTLLVRQRNEGRMRDPDHTRDNKR